MVVLVGVVILIQGAFYTIMFMKSSTMHLAEYTAATAIVQAKMDEIQGRDLQSPDLSLHLDQRHPLPPPKRCT